MPEKYKILLKIHDRLLTTIPYTKRYINVLEKKIEACDDILYLKIETRVVKGKGSKILFDGIKGQRRPFQPHHFKNYTIIKA